LTVRYAGSRRVTNSGGWDLVEYKWVLIVGPVTPQHQGLTRTFDLILRWFHPLQYPGEEEEGLPGFSIRLVVNQHTNHLPGEYE